MFLPMVLFISWIKMRGVEEHHLPKKNEVWTFPSVSCSKIKNLTLCLKCIFNHFNGLQLWVFDLKLLFTLSGESLRRRDLRRDYISCRATQTIALHSCKCCRASFALRWFCAAWFMKRLRKDGVGGRRRAGESSTELISPCTVSNPLTRSSAVTWGQCCSHGCNNRGQDLAKTRESRGQHKTETSHINKSNKTEKRDQNLFSIQVCF